MQGIPNCTGHLFLKWPLTGAKKKAAFAKLVLTKAAQEEPFIVEEKLSG